MRPQYQRIIHVLIKSRARIIWTALRLEAPRSNNVHRDSKDSVYMRDLAQINQLYRARANIHLCAAQAAIFLCLSYWNVSDIHYSDLLYIFSYLL